MKIDIYSDIVCPWCYVGERRFARALAALPDAAEIEVVFRPFQLDPQAPDAPVPVREQLARKFGALADAMTRRVNDAAAEEGIVMDWDRALAANTRTAHRLLRLAREEHGPAVQRDLAERLFAAHFSEGRDVSDHAQLTALAAAAGMNERRVREYLASGEGAEALEAELRHARAIGVTAVPTFVFAERFAVAGAQPVATFLEVLEEVRRRMTDEAGALP
jgi:predicted DsbA family dithiol-disulfide isomerase